jgi:hypothetical protein
MASLKVTLQLIAILALMFVAVLDSFTGDWGNFAVALCGFRFNPAGCSDVKPAGIPI